ncbi:peptidylprolyl isomerase [Sphingopyxis terrae]|nr:peptidylprolyl isomerase [Sphingopyxis terrae]MBD3746781.1 peptidylprolyl isomerase [Sphingopyxis terrae]
MKMIIRPMVLTALAFGLALPAMAQEAPATTDPVAAAAPATEAAPATDTATEAAPTIKPEQYLGNPEYMLNLDLSTGGRVVVQLYPDVAPHHVERVKQLARAGFYDGVKFHRVIDGFMAQTGDPTATGQGGSELPDLKAEFNDTPHLRGTVSMARAQSPDSANSQFFIMLQPRFSLDHNYTAFGRVVSGMQFVDAVHKGEPPAVMSRMVQVSVAADNKPMPPASMLTEDQPAKPATDITADQLNAPIQR